MLKYFWEYENNTEHMFVLIYDDDKYYGLSTYESVLKEYGDNGIIRKRYAIHNGNNLFMELHELIDNEENVVYIPILNANMQLVCNTQIQ